MTEREVIREPLTVLCLEDMPADAELIREHLADEEFDLTMDVAADRAQFVQLLDCGAYGVILADYTLPDFDAPAALELAKARCPDTPFICVSGTIGEDRAVELLKLGATDYVLKDRMGRLAFAIRRALDSARRQRERRASDDLNRLLVENMADVLWVMDAASRRFTYVSPSVERLRGFSAEEVMAEPVEATMRPEVAREVIGTLPARIESFVSGDPGVVSRVDEIEQIHKDGSVLQTEVATTLRLNDHGGVDIIGVTRDISKRKRVEGELADYRAHLEELVEERTERLRQANLALEEADHAKSAFLAQMSHELRTPLNSVIGFSDILLTGMAGELNDEQSKQIGMINQSGKHLLALINDILDLSKVEAGSVVVVPEPVDVSALVEDVVASFSVQAKERGLALVKELPPTQVTLTTDERLVRQILLNLLSNAVKFTESGSITVAVSTREHSLDLAVRDTGTGIAAEHLSQVFDEFWQIPDAVKTNRTGTGLGLTISAHLAALLGGSLTVESTFGEGSTFTLTLPKATSD
ncbi:MAG: hypothetical protein FD171_1348 [Actinobacteria bacterium]|nr:MAG: hypothetical protein FD171_1348 [Actinomycetota bacterium]